MGVELPVCSGQEAVRAFERAGWQIQRQAGSHVIMTKPGQWATLSVPNHRELDRGTLRALIRTAGLTVAEFVALLK
jgi:predicted RNA binding protein YcfA (HicA-like mRNA interferase family)